MTLGRDQESSLDWLEPTAACRREVTRARIRSLSRAGRCGHASASLTKVRRGTHAVRHALLHGCARPSSPPRGRGTAASPSRSHRCAPVSSGPDRGAGHRERVEPMDADPRAHRTRTRAAPRACASPGRARRRASPRRRWCGAMTRERVRVRRGERLASTGSAERARGARAHGELRPGATRCHVQAPPAASRDRRRGGSSGGSGASIARGCRRSRRRAHAAHLARRHRSRAAPLAPLEACGSGVSRRWNRRGRRRNRWCEDLRRGDSTLVAASHREARRHAREAV